MCLMVITSLCTVMLPRMSKLFAEGNRKQFEYYLQKSYSFAWFLGVPMCFGLISIASIFIPVFLGPGFEKSIILIYILSPIIIAISMSSITGNHLLLPSHLQKEYNTSVIVGACINLLINFVLIPRLFSIGAAIGTLVAEITVTCVQLYMCKKRGVLEYKIVFENSIKYLLAGCVMFFGIVFVKQWITVNIIGLITLIGIGGIIYAVFLLAVRDSLVIDTLSSVLRKVTKK